MSSANNGRKAVWQVVASPTTRRQMEEYLTVGGYPVIHEGLVPAHVEFGTVRAGVELSPAQRGVLVQLMDCDTTEEIAEKLSVSVETVRSHLKDLMAMLGTRSRHRTLVEAIRLGLLVVTPRCSPSS